MIASDETRQAAIARLISALRDFPVLGIRTNIPFLLRILEHERFQAGGVDTGFLDDEGEAMARASAEASDIPSHVLAAMSADDREPAALHFSTGADAESGTSQAPQDPWERLRGWRI